MAGKEDRIAVARHDADQKAQGEPSDVRLQVPAVGQTGAVDALGFESSVEAEVVHAHDNVVDHAAGRDQTDEPARGVRITHRTTNARRTGDLPGDDLCGAVAKLEEGDQRKDEGDREGVDRHSALGALAEDLRRVSVLSQAVQGASRTIKIRVAGRKDGRAQQGVHDVRQYRHAHVVHRDDVGRSGAGAGAS